MMTRADLEKQHETGLMSILSNDCVSEDLKVYAAVLLYKRGSRFLGFQDFQQYKTRVLDYLLQEYANTPLMPLAPSTNQDLAGRLHTRMVGTTNSVADAHETIAAHRENTLRSLADHDQELGNHSVEMAKIKADAKANLDTLETRHRNRIIDLEDSLFTLMKELVAFRKRMFWMVGGSFATSLLGSYLIHHFLR